MGKTGFKKYICLTLHITIFLDSAIVPKLNFGSCEEIKSHGVKIPATFSINGSMTYCPAWSELLIQSC